MTNKEKIKLFIRYIVSAFLFYSRINDIYRYIARKNQVTVLMYHRVIDTTKIDKSCLQPGMYVSWQAFKMQMEYLSQRYCVVTVGELIEAIEKGKEIQRRSCVITFDDGWKDFYSYAFPMLKKYNLPATVFLVSGYVGTNHWLWPEKVSKLLIKYFATKWFEKNQPIDYSSLENMGFFRLASEPGLTPIQKIEAIIEKMKDLEQNEIETVVNELESLLCIHPDQEYCGTLMLSWDEVKEMTQSRITFGSHTRDHSILTKVKKRKVKKEIAESKREIEKRILNPCFTFCYPNGNYNNEIKYIVMDHYRCAFTTQKGFVKPSDDPFALKRIDIHHDITFTKAMFACRISGILDILGL